MGKFHISKNGELVPCRAKIKCRLGGPHFDTMEEGMEYLDTYNEKAVEQENSIKKDDDQVKQEVIKEVLKAQGAVDSEEKALLTKEEAEWIKRLKENFGFIEAAYYIDRFGKEGNQDSFSYKIGDTSYSLENSCKDYDKEKKRLMSAFLYGYEVKKKKLYTVELPNSDPDSVWHSVLCKNISGKIVVDLVHQSVYDRWKERKNVKLTEEEIKKQRESYWKYAEEVKE